MRRPTGTQTGTEIQQGVAQDARVTGKFSRGVCVLRNTVQERVHRSHLMLPVSTHRVRRARKQILLLEFRMPFNRHCGSSEHYHPLYTRAERF
jgi:hypothetical protein